MSTPQITPEEAAYMLNVALCYLIISEFGESEDDPERAVLERLVAQVEVSGQVSDQTRQVVEIWRGRLGTTKEEIAVNFDLRCNRVQSMSEIVRFLEAVAAPMSTMQAVYRWWKQLANWEPLDPDGEKALDSPPNSKQIIEVMESLGYPIIA